MKRRKLTPFLAHEMLYDFATNQLDADRRTAIEEFLPTDRESQAILSNIQSALEYSKILSRTSVDTEILSHLKEAESAISLGKKYSSWSEWPEALRWSLTAIGLSALVAGIVAVVPWSRLNTKGPVSAGPETVEIAQIPVPTADELEAANVIADTQGSGDEPPEDEGSGDDLAEDAGGEQAIVAVGPETEVAAPSIPEVATLSPTPVLEDEPTPVAVAQDISLQRVTRITPYYLSRTTDRQLVLATLQFIPEYIVPPQRSRETTPAQAASVSAVAKKIATPSAASTTSASDVARPSDSKAKGFVYRAFMTLSELDDLGPKITDDLLSLGAEKAGEVELGWKRGSGRYYHFALPEENEQKVLEKLQVYGPVRISKDPHPRIMPEGEVRFILWVESAN